LGRRGVIYASQRELLTLKSKLTAVKGQKRAGWLVKYGGGGRRRERRKGWKVRTRG